MTVSKRNLLFQGAIFRFHVKFWEGNLPDLWGTVRHVQTDPWELGNFGLDSGNLGWGPLEFASGRMSNPSSVGIQTIFRNN